MRLPSTLAGAGGAQTAGGARNGMALRRHEEFALGGVDSRSNPTNFPPDRSIRCLNFAPMASGSLKLRSGYTVLGVTQGDSNANPVHSLAYYEQFSASYVGPQFVIYGKGAVVFTAPITGSPAPAQIGTMGSGNPWGHFRSNNYIFLSTGAASPNTNSTASWEMSDMQSWDGTTIRPAGLPPLGTVPVAVSNYAGSGSTLSFPSSPYAWASPGNIVGAPDSAFSTVSSGSTPNQFSQLLVASNFGFSLPGNAQITGMKVVVTGSGAAGPAKTRTSVGVAPYASGVSLTGGVFLYGHFDIVSGPVPIGGPTTSFGANLTPAVVNASTFQIAMYCISPFNTPLSASIDAVQVTIYYKGVAGGTVAVTSSSAGSFVPTQLTGYQLYLAIYNPITQHVGNRATLGNPVTVGATTSALVLSGLTALSGYNAEWVYAVGMTNDGGQIPYWLVDSQGNRIVLGNNATQGTITIGNVDALSELPIQNDPPPVLDKFCKVGNRIFAGLAASPFIRYSNDAADVSNANYVGNPWESWPANNAAPLPTGRVPTSMHAYGLEGFFFDKDYLSIWSQFLFQQGANPWRGPYNGGCCSQRAFVETPYGIYWVTPQKQLCTFMDSGVLPVSDEYEASLLGKISTANLGSTEIAYHLDPEDLIDEIVIKGLDANGNPVIIVHDFRLRDERSPHGQGYNYTYAGQTITTFCGAGFTPRQNAYDANAKMRLWAGNTAGTISQLEDGTSDGGANYTGDYIGLLNVGPNRPKIAELEIQGDKNLQVSYQTDYADGKLGDFTQVAGEQMPGDTPSGGSRWLYKINPPNEPRWGYVRLQLTSHPADGNFLLTDPPFLPIPTYGLINMSEVKLGLDRPEGR